MGYSLWDCRVRYDWATKHTCTNINHCFKWKWTKCSNWKLQNAMELSSMLCGSLDGRGVWGRMDTCIWMAELLYCSPETVTILLIRYTPIQNKKLKKESEKITPKTKEDICKLYIYIWFDIILVFKSRTFTVQLPVEILFFNTSLVFNINAYRNKPPFCSGTVSVDLFFLLNEPYFPVFLCALWFFVEHWTFEFINVITLEIRFYPSPEFAEFCYCP